jgi:hypothetical protein
MTAVIVETWKPGFSDCGTRKKPMAVRAHVHRHQVILSECARTSRPNAATDCVKDRLAAFYYWSDRQALEQALLVSLVQPVSIREVGRWSRAEGQESGLAESRRELNRRRRATLD